MKHDKVGIEPLEVDLYMESVPMTPQQEAEFSAFIVQRKNQYAVRQKAAAARRTVTKKQKAAA